MKIFDVKVNYTEDKDSNLAGYEIEFFLGNTSFNSYFMVDNGNSVDMHSSMCKGIESSIRHLVYAHINHFCRKINEN